MAVTTTYLPRFPFAAARPPGARSRPGDLGLVRSVLLDFLVAQPSSRASSMIGRIVAARAISSWRESPWRSRRSSRRRHSAALGLVRGRPQQVAQQQRVGERLRRRNGVMAATTGAADSKSTSPTSFSPPGRRHDVDAHIHDHDSRREHVAADQAGLAAATISISASRVWRASSRVFEWRTVTVPCSRTSSRAAGLPTTFERPTTTTRLPAISMPERFRISTKPRSCRQKPS